MTHKPHNRESRTSRNRESYIDKTFTIGGKKNPTKPESSLWALIRERTEDAARKRTLLAGCWRSQGGLGHDWEPYTRRRRWCGSWAPPSFGESAYFTAGCLLPARPGTWRSTVRSHGTTSMRLKETEAPGTFMVDFRQLGGRIPRAADKAILTSP